MKAMTHLALFAEVVDVSLGLSQRLNDGAVTVLRGLEQTRLNTHVQRGSTAQPAHGDRGDRGTAPLRPCWLR